MTARLWPLTRGFAEKETRPAAWDSKESASNTHCRLDGCHMGRGDKREVPTPDGALTLSCMYEIPEPRDRGTRRLRDKW